MRLSTWGSLSWRGSEFDSWIEESPNVRTGQGLFPRVISPEERWFDQGSDICPNVGGVSAACPKGCALHFVLIR